MRTRDRLRPLRRARQWPLLAAALLLGASVAGAYARDVKPYPAPKLPKKGWLNTDGNKALSLDELRGRVVLVEFWTFACFNCRNVLPYVKAWHEKYAAEGLIIIGVHTPELDFEREPEKVREAIVELGITFPVVLDNDYATWNRYRNEYWPAIYLIDSEGQVVYVAIGEGNYERTEARIQQLLEKAKKPAATSSQ
ncbi:MAG: redoxin domain-containing protein [Acidobacteria bacterium]|nr:redoxin domain-containing protein [Acidobacteriota bacterium]